MLPSATGAALLTSQFTTIAELEINPGAQLGILEEQTSIRQLTVTNHMSLTNATLFGAVQQSGGPAAAYLSVQLPASAVLSMVGSNLLRHAIVTNAGTANLSGGSGARLDLDLNGIFTNAPNGTTTVVGEYVFGYTSSGQVDNQGTWINQGPGIVSIERSGVSGGRFDSTGLFEIREATFKLLNPPAGFQHNFITSLRLRDGIFDGGSYVLFLVGGKYLEGSGTVIGTLSISGGRLDLNAVDGGPYGLLNVVGNVETANSTEIVVDVGGPAPTQHDRMIISGSARWAIIRPRVRMLGGYAPGIDTSISIASHASLIPTTVSIHDRVFSDYPLSLALRASASQLSLRVVPTLTVADTEIIEGNSGTQVMQVSATLSAATTETVSFSYSTFPGTATEAGGGGLVPDYSNALGSVIFAPGETSQQIPLTIHGDGLIEPNEAFSILSGDGQNSSNLQNASFGNYRRFRNSSEGLVLDDDGPPGTRYVLIGKITNLPTMTGQVSFLRRYTTDGAYVDGWPNLMPVQFGNRVTGICGAPNGDVLITRWSTTLGPLLMSASGAVLDKDFGGLMGYEESCSFGEDGTAWVGEAVDPSANEALLRHIASDGRVLEAVQVPVGERGTDWVELDANQCTLYYTSEDADVRRYDVCTHQVMADFVSLPGAPCYAMRQLPNLDLMFTCKDHIFRYDQNAALVRDYTRESLGESDAGGLFAIQLDPDGQTFWTGGVDSGRVVRARLDDGSVVTSFMTGDGGVNGLLVQDALSGGISDLIFADGFEP